VRVSTLPQDTLKAILEVLPSIFFFPHSFCPTKGASFFPVLGGSLVPWMCRPGADLPFFLFVQRITREAPVLAGATAV